MIYRCIHEFFVKPCSPHVKWKPVLANESQEGYAIHFRRYWIFSTCWRCCDTGGNFYLPAPVIMSSDEQKELKEKLYSLCFYNHYFRALIFFFQSHRVLLHGIHRRLQRPFKPWRVFKQPGEGQLIVLTLKDYWGKAMKFFKESVNRISERN